MGKAKRCRAIMVGASVAALGATGACPAAHATNEHSAHAQRPVVAHDRGRHSHRPATTAPPGGYVYEVDAEGETSVNDANAVCSGSQIRVSGLTLSSEGPDEGVTKPPVVARNSFELWTKNPAAWERLNTVTMGPQTTITYQHDTTTASSMCAATTPDANVASIGRATVTWRLPTPVDSLASLLAQVPASVILGEYIASFEILPNGTVPTFTPYNPTA